MKKRLAAALGTTVLSLGLVVACDQADDSRKSVADQTGPTSSQKADDRASDPIDIDQWADKMVAAKVTTARVVEKTINTDASGRSTTTSTEGSMDLTDPDSPRLMLSATVEGRDAGGILLTGGKLYRKQFSSDSYEEVSISLLGTTLNDLDQRKNFGKQRRTAITDVRLVGQEKVGGVQTDHYSVVLDTAEMNLTTHAESSFADDTLVADYWVDDEMRIIKYSVEIAMIDTDGQVFSQSNEVVCTDHGNPVNIKAPTT